MAANPPAKRSEYRTDIPGCYLRVGPCSLSLSVIRRDSTDRQIRLTIPLDPLDLPDLPTLKRAIRVAKDQCSSDDIGAMHAHSLMAVGGRVIESKRLAINTEKNYVRSLNYLVDCTNDAVPVRSTEIRRLHKQIASKHGTAGANSAIKLLRTIMKTAHSDDISFPAWPTDGVRGIWSPETPRETKLSFEQLPLVWAADLPDHWLTWLRFALLTGMRRSETQRAYLQGGDVVVDRTKNFSALRIPATDAIRCYIDDYSAIRCFKPLSKHLLALTGIRVTPHDLRRTFASMGRRVGVQQNTISWLMNHKTGRNDQTSRYQGRPESTVLESALLAIEAGYRDAGCTI
jgi:integrase